VREVKVIPNGTDTTPLPELKPKRLEKPLCLIAVSRLAPNKRVDHAIQLTRLLRQQGIDTQLTIVGTGEVEQPLKQLVSDLQLSSHVTFTGHVTEVEKNAHLQSAHLLVHTSLREGWGLNVIEANAMGTPAMVYPVHGLVDSTVHNETGLVTKGETPESLVDSISTLLKAPDQYDRLRLNAWRRSRTFEWANVLPAACEWLESQAAKPRG
jgi:glycosyltransferase involved in cell wall biosynthesis